jgi:hypothetical protein
MKRVRVGTIYRFEPVSWDQSINFVTYKKH